MRLILVTLFVFICGSFNAAQAGGESQEAADSGNADVQLNEKCDYKKIAIGEHPLPVADMLYRSVDEPCSSLMNETLTNQKPEDIYAATKSFSDRVMNHFSKWAQDNKGKSVDDAESEVLQEKMKDKVKSMTTLGAFLKNKCPNEKESSDACKARQTYADFGKRLAKLFEGIEKMGKAEQEKLDREAIANSPEHKFKMKFCSNSDLMATLYYFPKPIQSNCIYLISDKTARFVVIQSIDGGVLAAPPGNEYIASKAIYLRTGKQYADGDPLPSQYLKSTGLKKYIGLGGVGKTVNSFQYLGDADTSGD
jgi:nitrous oxide reductase accessory protein NosL